MKQLVKDNLFRIGISLTAALAAFALFMFCASFLLKNGKSQENEGKKNLQAYKLNLRPGTVDNAKGKPDFFKRFKQ